MEQRDAPEHKDVSPLGRFVPKQLLRCESAGKASEQFERMQRGFPNPPPWPALARCALIQREGNERHQAHDDIDGEDGPHRHAL